MALSPIPKIRHDHAITGVIAVAISMNKRYMKMGMQVKEIVSLERAQREIAFAISEGHRRLAAMSLKKAEKDWIVETQGKFSADILRGITREEKLLTRK